MLQETFDKMNFTEDELVDVSIALQNQIEALDEEIERWVMMNSIELAKSKVTEKKNIKKFKTFLYELKKIIRKEGE